MKSQPSRQVRGFGNVFFCNSFVEGDGCKVTNSFLQNLLVNMVKQSLRYHSSQTELPFTFREKQLHSVMCPAISKLTDSFLVEAPVSRKHKSTGTEDVRGWVDYWCEYRNTTYFVEVKQEYYSLQSREVRKELKDKWLSANEQLSSVKAEIKDWLHPGVRGGFRVSFVFVPFFVKKLKDEHMSLESINEHHNFVCSSLNEAKREKRGIKYEVNWKCLIHLNRNIVGPYECKGGVEEHYPAIGVYCCVNELQKP